MSRPTWVPRSALTRFRVRDCHTLWSAFPGSSANMSGSYRGPATPMPLSKHRFRLIFPGSLATTTGITRCFLFLRVLRCFTSPGSLLVTMNSSQDSRYTGGLPHSEIPGYNACYGLPRLIAVIRVLLRFLVPRHPP